MVSEIEHARELLDNATSIAVITHTRPDGDAVASLLAFFLSLREIGKPVSAVLHDPLPPRFKSLPGADLIMSRLPEGEHLLIAVDCADPRRIGLPADKKPEGVDINIDHHPTNTNFGRINFVDYKAASTTQVLYRLMQDLDLPITVDIASNLMAGLITDTIGFRTENVQPEVFSMSAELLAMGIPMAEIYQKSLTEQSYSAVKLWGFGISNLEREGELIWTQLSLGERAAARYEGVDDADLTNLLSAIEGIRVAVVFIEQPNGTVKISFRSRHGFDVAGLAGQFGGGGHTAAAGAMVEGKLDETIEEVLTATREYALVNSERGL